MRTLLASMTVLLAFLLAPQVSVAAGHETKYRHAGCHTHKCDNRVDKKLAIHRIYRFCNTWRCVRHVARKREAREMAYYKRHPMPYCTWGPESGVGRPEWSIIRYRQPNVSGGTGGGKFQILSSTWANHGGLALAAGPVDAKPVYQERIARRVEGSEGLGAWVNC